MTVFCRRCEYLTHPGRPIYGRKIIKSAAECFVKVKVSIVGKSDNIILIPLCRRHKSSHHPESHLISLEEGLDEYKIQEIMES